MSSGCSACGHDREIIPGPTSHLNVREHTVRPVDCERSPTFGCAEVIPNTHARRNGAIIPSRCLGASTHAPFGYATELLRHCAIESTSELLVSELGSKSDTNPVVLFPSWVNDTRVTARDRMTPHQLLIDATDFPCSIDNA